MFAHVVMLDVDVMLLGREFWKAFFCRIMKGTGIAKGFGRHWDFFFLLSSMYIELTLIY